MIPFLSFFQLTVELYEMLETVDKFNSHLRFMDPISDFLYPSLIAVMIMMIIITIIFTVPGENMLDFQFLSFCSTPVWFTICIEMIL